MRIIKIFRIMKFIVFLGSVAIAYGADIRCYDGSFYNYSVYPIDNLNPFLNSSFYQPELKLIVYTFGLDGEATGPSVEEIVGTIIGRSNICLLNWEKEASAGILVPINYARAIRNAKLIGAQFGETLVKLYEAGVNPSNVHLLGFSLGAQLYGYTGRKVIEKGYMVDRITGLDPAGPLFDGTLSLNGLSASDARVVVVLHTNPGGYGTDESIADIDIWANCESRVQPGCEGSGLISFFLADLCSHDRSWQYFSEAIERPTAFEARSATGCDAWKAGEVRNETVYLRDDTNAGTNGSSFMRTNSTPLYGLGEPGSYSACQSLLIA